MADHGHGGGGHGGGHGGGGGGGGPGLPIDIAVAGTPLGFVSWAGGIIAVLISLEVLRIGWLALTNHITWEGLVIPMLMAGALILSPRLAGKILTTMVCFALGTLFLWVTYMIMCNMYANIEHPFAVRTPDARGYFRLLVGWAWCLAILAVPFLMGMLPLAFAGWLWWGKPLGSGGHH